MGVSTTGASGQCPRHCFALLPVRAEPGKGRTVAGMAHQKRDDSAEASNGADVVRALDALARTEIDPADSLNGLHLPDDAGNYAPGLEKMLRRIPDGWGRWVSCDTGWYGLLVSLDEQIAALLPDYQIRQVKEKYGTLRFYWAPPELIPECCAQRRLDDPRPTAEPVSVRVGAKSRSPQLQAALDAWSEREIAHLGSDTHTSCMEALRNGPEAARRASVIEQVEALVKDAERRSAEICERCSGRGRLREQRSWLKTLCDTCAGELHRPFPVALFKKCCGWFSKVCAQSRRAFINRAKTMR